MNNIQIAKQLINNLGGIDNIQKLENCMTRVRVSLIDKSQIKLDNIKKIDKVLGVVEVSDQYQIVFGPNAAAITVEMHNIINNNDSDQINRDIKPNIDNLKAQTSQKYKLSISSSLKQFANIFIPLIPALIGSGFILGIINILKNPAISGSFAIDYPNFINLLSVFGNSVFYILMIFIGVTSAQVFKGSIAIGAVLAGILTNPMLSQVELFGKALNPSQGGIFAVILVVWFGCFVERFLRKYLKGALDLILIPLLTILITGVIAIIILQPIGGYISNGIGQVSMIAIQNGGIFAGFILGGAFLPLVMTGLHQGLIPIHIQLIHEYGYTVLYPILAMAGAGQVGASFAVLLKTKNSRLKKIIKSALPLGILGIGEPLIYGVTLPLGKPFLTACIGGAFGGGVVAFFKVGTVSLGISGLPLALSVMQGQIFSYLLALITAYIIGFLCTYIIGFKDPVD
ncbi:PTS transporter subunit EIIC [Rickettsiales bacterium LUAb2]